MNEHTWVDTFDTAAGPLVIHVDQAGRLKRCSFADGPGSDARPTRAAGDSMHVHNPRACEHVRSQILEYFSGARRSFDLELAPEGTPFQRKVWEALAGIPWGQTRSYGELATATGNPRAMRAVGRANGENPIVVVIPCHRVVSADGSIGGFSAGADRKRILLALEGLRLF